MGPLTDATVARNDPCTFPVLRISSRSVVAPGAESATVAGLNAAVRPRPAGTAMFAAAVAATPALLREVAVTPSKRLPTGAPVTAPITTGTVWLAPAATETEVAPRVAKATPGPAVARSNVSAALPVFVTVS